MRLVRHAEGKSKFYFSEIKGLRCTKKIVKIWMFKNEIMNSFDSSD